MNTPPLYPRYRDRLEDFWDRRANTPAFTRTIRLFGHPINLSSNDETALSAADLCRPLYTGGPPVDTPACSVQIAVHAGPENPGPAPEDLSRRMHFAGHGTWITLQAGAWGAAFADLAARRAHLVLSPQLAERPDLIAASLLNTLLLNFLIAGGLGMLHASCLMRHDRALLLLAPHNTGKSTTALRLVRAGYRLLTDSMVFVSRHRGNPLLLGFPVGRVKLRADVLPEFPDLRDALRPEQVRDETKYSLDLRAHNPAMVHEQAAEPRAIDLCLLRRENTPETRLTPAAQNDVWDAVTRNSLFYDTEDVWHRNLDRLAELIDASRWHHLTIGTRPEHLEKTIGSLWTGTG